MIDVLIQPEINIYTNGIDRDFSSYYFNIHQYIDTTDLINSSPALLSSIKRAISDLKHSSLLSYEDLIKEL